MATVEEYVNGKIVVHIQRTLEALSGGDEPLPGSKTGDAIMRRVGELDPWILTQSEVEEIINKAETCAAGERVCRAGFPDTPLTEAVFLDELADGMVGAGKARSVTKPEAAAILAKYPQQTLVMSKVTGTGKHMELCRTYPETCVYWNMTRRGLPILKKYSSRTPDKEG